MSQVAETGVSFGKAQPAGYTGPGPHSLPLRGRGGPAQQLPGPSSDYVDDAGAVVPEHGHGQGSGQNLSDVAGHTDVHAVHKQLPLRRPSEVHDRKLHRRRSRRPPRRPASPSRSRRRSARMSAAWPPNSSSLPPPDQMFRWSPTGVTRTWWWSSTGPSGEPSVAGSSASWQRCTRRSRPELGSAGDRRRRPE